MNGNGLADGLRFAPGFAIVEVVMSRSRELFARIDRLSARAARATVDGELLAEIEDTLAQGYMHALTEEARSRRLGRRLEALVNQIDEPGVAAEARRIAGERRTLDRTTGELRRRLAVMREQFVRLGGGQSATR